jgi:hypothetical protein
MEQKQGAADEEILHRMYRLGKFHFRDETGGKDENDDDPCPGRYLFDVFIFTSLMGGEGINVYRYLPVIQYPTSHFFLILGQKEKHSRQSGEHDGEENEGAYFS